MKKRLCSAKSRWMLLEQTKKQRNQKKLIAELEMDIVLIEGLIAFTGSEAGEKVFGKEIADNLMTHALENQAAGAKYCDCPACVAVAAILDKKDEGFHSL